MKTGLSPLLGSSEFDLMNPLNHRRPGVPHGMAGFTLVELLVSMAVLALLFLVVSSVITGVQKAWRQSSSKVSEFREARRAFDKIVNALAQAELNNYLCYRYKGMTDPLVPPSKNLNAQPAGYLRYSDLQFVCGPSQSQSDPKLTGLPESTSPGHAVFFQAPLGTSDSLRLPTALSGGGFFVKFSDDGATRPDFLQTLGKPTVSRYRLFEYRSPIEFNRAYDSAGVAWYSDFDTYSRPVANNIILLIISPRRASADGAPGNASTDIAPNYSYDSTPKEAIGSGPQNPNDFQLPPMLAITLVALDEASAENLALSNGNQPPLTAELSANRFRDATKFNDDISSLSDELVKRKLNFRIFNSTIPIRASKWGKGT